MLYSLIVQLKEEALCLHVTIAMLAITWPRCSSWRLMKISQLIQRRKGGAAVLVDKDAFERYRKAALDAEFAEIMQSHGTAYTELSKR